MDYKEKLEEAKRLYETANADQRYVLESLFPELRESDDERIRREIINYFKCQSREEPSRKDTHNKWIVWLEKVITPNHNDIDSSFIEDIKNVINEAPLLMQSDKEKMIDWLEKQGEKSSVIRWYDVSLIPQEMKELLVEWDSEDATWHEIAFYHTDTKTFWNGTRQVENVTRWCYITDLLEKQGEKEPIIEMKSAEESLGIDSETYNKIVDECIYGEQKPTQEIEPFEAEHGKYYYCIKDYFCGGRKQASKGDVVQALRGLPIMGLKDAGEYFLPVNSIKCNSAWSEEDEKMLVDAYVMLDWYKGNNWWTARRIKDWLNSLKERIGGISYESKRINDRRLSLR